MLFLDEIHRFNKAQQDALLPAVEDGLLTLIGATTENPAFEVNGALLSRAARVCAEGADRRGARAVLRARRGELGARWSDGGARRSSRCAAKATPAPRSTRSSWRRTRPPSSARSASRSSGSRTRCSGGRCCTTKAGDRHYDYISAWIKATRGSDPDASLYYLAVMLEGGEDPRFIVRRMVILASEDIGNADPPRSAWPPRRPQAVEHVGLPEAALCAGAGGDLPRARAQVRTPPAGRLGAAERARARARRRAGAGPAALGTPPGPGARRPTTTRTATPGTSRPGAAARTPSPASASTSPKRPSRSWPSASSRFAGRGARGAIIART